MGVTCLREMVATKDSHHQTSSEPALCSPGLLTSPYLWRFLNNPALFQLPGDWIPDSSVCTLLSVASNSSTSHSSSMHRAPSPELPQDPVPNLDPPRSLRYHAPNGTVPCPPPPPQPEPALITSLPGGRCCCPTAVQTGPGCTSVLLAANTSCFLSLDASGLPADPHTCHKAFSGSSFC